MPRQASPRLRRRQRSAVELAVRRQRQSFKLNQRRRNHVVRKIARQRSPKRANVDRTPSRSHHITNQPLARTPIVARHHNSLRHTLLTQQNSLDLARLDPEPAKLHLQIRAPQKLQNPIRTPPRKVTGPVHPAPRRTRKRPIRIRDKPLPRQTRTVEIPPRKPNTPNVKLPNNTPRNRLKTTVQDINTITR